MKQKLSTKLMNKNKLITKGEVYKIIDDEIKRQKRLKKNSRGYLPLKDNVYDAKCEVLLFLKRGIKNHESD